MVESEVWKMKKMKGAMSLVVPPYSYPLLQVEIAQLNRANY